MSDTDKLLWSSLWPADLPADLRQHLDRLSRQRRLRAGEQLYARGDAPEGLIGVRSGMIRTVIVTEEGQEFLFGAFPTGSWLGEISLFDDLPRPHNAYAVGDTDVVILPTAEFRKLMDAHPQWYTHFARVLCNKLRVCFDYIEDMAVLTLRQRVAKRLLDLGQVYGRQTDQGLSIELHLPQEDLARMLGATRQSINKELRALEGLGLILMQRQGRISLRDPARLRGLITGARSG